MKFRTLVVDVPWDYADKLRMGSGPAHRGAASQYACMSFADILALPVGDLAEADAHLYLWTTNAFMVEAHRLAEAWGFRQRTILTWVKGREEDGETIPHIGMGHFYRNNTEHALFCVRGKLPPLRRDAPTAFTAPRTRHSAKPPAFFDLVESVSPPGYCEIFGRGMARLGWTALGNEVGKGGDIRDSLREVAAA